MYKGIFSNLIIVVTALSCAQQQATTGAPIPSKDETAALGDGSSNLDNNAAQVFVDWCEKAGETAVIRQKLSSYFDRFCGRDGPKKLLTDALIRQAYRGSGSAKKHIALLEKPTHDSSEKTTEMLIGVAIKLPISVEQHFKKVAPLASTPEKAKASFPQEADVDIEVLKKYEGEGRYHVRGFKVETHSSQKLAGSEVETHTEARDDQWELVEGEAYMYTSYITKRIKQIEETDMLTAAVTIDSGSYLISQAYIKVKNKGLPSVAEETVKDTAVRIVEGMYNLAEEAK